MKITQLTAADFRTSTWSGGTTTELFLYPENGSYAARDFLFRISSATVDLEESDFTPLQGVERYITPLEGSFVLAHPGAQPRLCCRLWRRPTASGAMCPPIVWAGPQISI